MVPFTHRPRSLLYGVLALGVFLLRHNDPLLQRQFFVENLSRLPWLWESVGSPQTLIGAQSMIG
jgi:hypothetical protein